MNIILSTEFNLQPHLAKITDFPQVINTWEIFLSRFIQLTEITSILFETRY